MHLKTTEKPSVVKNAKVVKDMLNDLIGEVTVTEYGEKLKLDKECSEDTGTLWKSTIKESHTEKRKNIQDDVISSVLTSMNLYFDAMKSRSYSFVIPLFTEKKKNKYAIHAYTHGPVTGFGFLLSGVKPLK